MGSDTLLNMDFSDLPTPIASSARRLGVTDPQSGDFFLATSYVSEVGLKLIGCALHGALKTKATEQAYRMGYQMVRADGLGVWEQWIRIVSSQPLAGFLPPVLNDLVAWLTSHKSPAAAPEFHATIADAKAIFRILEIEDSIPDRRPTIRDLISALVQLRNKTKAHGAVGPNFFQQANGLYFNITAHLVRSCPLFRWRWLHLTTRANGSTRGLILRGSSPSFMRDADVEGIKPGAPGVHYWPEQAIAPFSCAALIRSDIECSVFYLPNGGQSGELAWFLDYATGRASRENISEFTSPPTPLPASETAGLATFDVQSNVFGNLPSPPRNYVQRPSLESELERRLRDRNHPIITLHGRGGIGKTSLALYVAHCLAAEAEPLFEYIVWFSARDIDLKPSGPKDVRAGVVDLMSISRQFGTLFEADESIESFAQVLQEPIERQKGCLFIFDNFETLEDAKTLHEFLDTHTHIPNKVLITSRERAFKADFPIEVVGMSREEAGALMRSVAQELDIGEIVTAPIEQGIYEYSEGHPYVVRVILGEVAKEGRYTPPAALLPRRLDIVEAVFERSFNRLSDAGRRVFLTVSSWRSAVSELALLVVLSQRGLDVEEGIAECTRLSLLERRAFLDDQPAYVAPQLARLFGRRKLKGDPDRLAIQEDLAILHKFGVIPVGQPISVPEDSVLTRFAEWCVAEGTSGDEEHKQRVGGILLSLAELWPEAWLTLARYRATTGFAAADVGYALRRAVEDLPMRKDVHLERAAFLRLSGDDAAFIASRLRAVEADPDDVTLLREVAFDVCKYITEHSSAVPPQRRSVYVANLREMMRDHAEVMDATGLSRLAWLYLLEDNREEAWRYASLGLKREADNRHCFNIVQRLRQDGYTDTEKPG